MRLGEVFVTLSCAGWLVLGPACSERRLDAAPRAAAGVPRVVSLHDVTSELMVELGAARALVGIADPVDVTSAIEAQLAPIARVASLESILALHPDLVLGLGVVAEREPELVRRLRESGVEVHLETPERLDDVYELTRWVARRVGAAARGQALIAGLQQRVSAIAARTGAPLRVFVYDCCDPPFTAGGKALLSDLIARAGGINVFAEDTSDWLHVSWEAVAARRPDLIVVDAYRYEGQGDLADKQRALRAIQALDTVPTTLLPLGCSLGGLRSAEGLERLAGAIAEHS